MRKIIFIVSILVIIIALAVYITVPTKSSLKTSQSMPSLPVSGSVSAIGVSSGASTSTGSQTAPSISIDTQAGSATVLDFIHNGVTWADAENQGSYLLAGSAGYCLSNGTCPGGASTTDFSISYNSSTSFFNIVLLTEPISRARSEAELFLESQLGIQPQALCTLKYFVGTPYYVNTFYAGKNLGFSFCPGATVLP